MRRHPRPHRLDRWDWAELWVLVGMVSGTILAWVVLMAGGGQ